MRQRPARSGTLLDEAIRPANFAVARYKRMYGGMGIGFEATLGEYITSLVTLFREVRRVLKNDGVLASCPEGGRVLDCFGGAGTTALAALQLGHTAISIDINPEYTEEARQRIATELRGRGDVPDTLAAD
jgi:DNA methylase